MDDERTAMNTVPGGSDHNPESKPDYSHLHTSYNNNNAGGNSNIHMGHVYNTYNYAANHLSNASYERDGDYRRSEKYYEIRAYSGMEIAGVMLAAPPLTVSWLEHRQMTCRVNEGNPEL